MKKSPFFLKKKFMGAFIAIIMVASIGGIFSTGFNNEEKPKDINGRLFYPLNNAWFTYVGNQRYSFEYLPTHLENISSVQFINLDSPKVYLITDVIAGNISLESAKNRLAAVLY